MTSSEGACVSLQTSFERFCGWLHILLSGMVSLSLSVSAWPVLHRRSCSPSSLSFRLVGFNGLSPFIVGLPILFVSFPARSSVACLGTASGLASSVPGAVQPAPRVKLPLFVTPQASHHYCCFLLLRIPALKDPSLWNQLSDLNDVFPNLLLQHQLNHFHNFIYDLWRTGMLSMCPQRFLGTASPGLSCWVLLRCPVCNANPGS